MLYKEHKNLNLNKTNYLIKISTELIKEFSKDETQLAEKQRNVQHCY